MPRKLLAGWKIVAVFAVFGIMVWFTTKYIVFQSQSVRIEKVEFLCYAIRYNRWRLPFEERDATALTADCKGVEKFVKDQQRRQRRQWRLVPATYASFSYLSPADGVIHKGRIQRGLNDQHRAIKIGDNILIYASIFSPESFTDFSSPTWP